MAGWEAIAFYEGFRVIRHHLGLISKAERGQIRSSVVDYFDLLKNKGVADSETVAHYRLNSPNPSFRELVKERRFYSLIGYVTDEVLKGKSPESIADSFPRGLSWRLKRQMTQYAERMQTIFEQEHRKNRIA